MASKSALCVWDLTLSVSKSTINGEELRKVMHLLFKKFIYQRELAKPPEDIGDGTYSSEYDYGSDIGSGSCFDEWMTSEEEEEEEEAEESQESDFDIDNYANIDNEEDDNEDDNYISESEGSESDYDSDIDLDEDGQYDHWQIRGSLHKRKRLGEIMKLIKNNSDLDILRSAHWSPSSTNSLGSDFYCMKIDTKHPDDLSVYRNDDDEPVYIPWQIRKVQELYSWQQELLDRALYLNDGRSISLVYDKEGGIGKSTFGMWLACYGYGVMIPSFNSIEDIMNCVYCQKPQKLYVCDMPRAQDKGVKQIAEMYAGFENLRSGWCYDKRYSFKQRYQDSAPIIIFSNSLPNKKLLTLNRWKIYVVEDNELYLYPSGKKDVDIPYPMDQEEREAVKEAFNYLREYAASRTSGDLDLSEDVIEEDQSIEIL